MLNIIKRLEVGWEAETDMELVCSGKCKESLTVDDLHYCEQDMCFYCLRCINKHHIIQEHQDWQITKIKEQKEV